MKKHFCSVISKGVISSCFEYFTIERDYLSVFSAFSNGKNIYLKTIKNAIFSKAFGFVKVFFGTDSFTFSVWNSKKILKEFQNLGIVCEAHDKKKHNPNKSNYSFWFYE